MLSLNWQPLSALASASKSKFEKYLLLADNESWDAAFAMIDNLVKSAKPDSDYLSERGRVNTELKRYKEALADLDMALKLDPKSAMSYRRRSYCCFVLKRYKEGIADIDKAIRLVGSDPITVVPLIDYGNRAQAYMLIGRKDLAAADAIPAKACRGLKQALELRKASKLTVATNLANKLSKSQPGLIQGYMVRGILNLSVNKFKSAIVDFDKVLGRSPDLVPFLYYRADAFKESAQYEMAIKDYTKIISLKPKQVNFDMTANTGRYRQHFEYKDSNIVNLADIHFLRGSCYAHQNKFAPAEADFSECVALDKMEWEGYFERGNARFNLGKIKESIADYDVAFRLKKDFWDCLVRRASAYESLKQFDSAIADLTTIIKNNPTDAGTYQLRANLFERLNARPRAIGDYSKMITISPDDDDGYKYRADLYFKMGRFKEALADYDKAIELGSEDRVALLKLRALTLAKMRSERK
ncbi:MAG: tetratricopeptide repeat protein [Candidatus Obscuribacterales bacterium]|nr:tetratricopeptide repeat protein [Candidatus Obscuribacterales bacterium]